MKHLKIVYGEAVLWDGPVGSLEWSDSESGVKIEGRVSPKPESRMKPVSGSSSGMGLGGILEMLSKASKAKAVQITEEKGKAAEAGGVARNTGIVETGIVETVEPELEDSA